MSRAAIVNQPSSVCPDQILVMPGNPDASYLFRKVLPLAADAACSTYIGTIMPPPPSAALSGSQQSIIRAWIAGGAPKN